MRVLWLFVILFTVASLIFLLTNYAMYRQYPSPIPRSQYLVILFTQYFEYMIRILLYWDWGTPQYGLPVWEIFLYHVPHTMRLILISFFLSLFGGVFLGVVSAVFKEKWIDKIISSVTLTFASIPNYIWVFAFMLIFGYILGWFPPIPLSQTASQSLRLKALVIPIAALSLAPTAKFTSLIRNELSDASYADYILLLRVKGLTQTQIIFRHLIKDSIVAIMPEIATTFTFVLTGSFLLEYINNVPGTSILLYRSLLSPMMGGHYFNVNVPYAVLVCVFYTSMGLFVVLIVDLIYPLIDPRIRIGSKKAN
jgi:ABC-type dipeptide/oligopeptide/nickel transport system permease component